MSELPSAQREAFADLDAPPWLVELAETAGGSLSTGLLSAMHDLRDADGAAVNDVGAGRDVASSMREMASALDAMLAAVEDEG